VPEISLPFCKRKLVGSCGAEYQRAARRAEKQIPQLVDGNAYVALTLTNSCGPGDFEDRNCQIGLGLASFCRESGYA